MAGRIAFQEENLLLPSANFMSGMVDVALKFLMVSPGSLEENPRLQSVPEFHHFREFELVRDEAGNRWSGFCEVLGSGRKMDPEEFLHVFEKGWSGPEGMGLAGKDD